PSYLLALYYSVTTSPHHPDLHSFPTRRSSDLNHAFRLGAVVHQHVIAGHTNYCAAPARRCFFLAAAALGRRLLARMATFKFFQKDRKSTRLNSSHQIISYAVFCLKKKKGKESRSTHRRRGARGGRVEGRGGGEIGGASPRPPAGSVGTGVGAGTPGPEYGARVCAA